MNIYDEQRLTRAIQKYGEGAKYVQMIRDQIASEARGQSAREMYITGMVKRRPAGKNLSEPSEAPTPDPSLGRPDHQSA